MSNLWQDVSYALRGLRRSPGFTAVALLTLAAGIGANTAMFSVLNAVLLRPLPYRAPEQLTMLWTEAGRREGEGRSSYADVQRWRARSKSFADMAVFDPVAMTLTGSDELKQISGVRASPNLFALLGAQPDRGRVFTQDDADQRRRVVLISHRFWRSTIAGLALGLVGALWLGRVGSSLLFGISATDPLTYVSVSLLLTAVALAGCYFPARRAARFDPLVALR